MAGRSHGLPGSPFLTPSKSACLRPARRNCASRKDETVVKYSVIQESQQLFASKYQRVLPTEAELIAEIEREKRLISAHRGLPNATGAADSEAP